MADRNSKGREPAGSGLAGQQAGPAADRIQVILAHDRWHHFGWLVGCAVAGTLLILELGTVGKYVGALLIGIAAWRGYSFARTLLYPAGTFVIHGDEVVLPPGLCRPGSGVTVPLAQIQHVFLLRRALLWNQSAPLLVIETDKEAYSYPRDWFSTETEQAKLVHAIGKRLGTAEGTSEPGSKRADGGQARSAHAQAGSAAREGET